MPLSKVSVTLYSNHITHWYDLCIAASTTMGHKYGDRFYAISIVKTKGRKLCSDNQLPTSVGIAILLVSHKTVLECR